ncbi:DNA recombination protein [Corynebacterium renale]|nr:DNA recombination protein [Corynebacterium renale]
MMFEHRHFFSVHVWVVCHSGVMDIVLGLLVGLLGGVIIGWLAHARSSSQATEKPPAIGPKELNATMTPLHEAMGELAGALRGLEKERTQDMAALKATVHSMARTSTRLSDRTEALVSSLRSPNIRGRWGEVQLQRVVELGGMEEHCDFDTQVSRTVNGHAVRPDMIIRLAGGRSIVVDAKAPFGAYLDALENQDPEEHAALLRRHAHHMRRHVNALAAKDYVEAFHPTPEFVVMFVPADPFLDTALQSDPELLDYALEKSVVIATPSTLFALLRTVALGWRQESFSDNAREIHRLGAQLYTRLGTLADHLNKIGAHLDKAVSAYNSALANIDSRVMVTARKLSELGVTARPSPRDTQLDAIDSRPRRASQDDTD